MLLQTTVIQEYEGRGVDGGGEVASFFAADMSLMKMVGLTSTQL